MLYVVFWLNQMQTDYEVTFAMTFYKVDQLKYVRKPQHRMCDFVKKQQQH